MIHGVIIPGLGMAKGELPPVPGFIPLDNPEIGGGLTLDAPSYTLRDVAFIHAQTIASIVRKAEPFWVIGMSMGGMVASILASEFRHQLPSQTRFNLMVTSANTAACRAVDEARLKEWITARPGAPDTFRAVMANFFSRAFLESHPASAEGYYQYRSSGGNKQSPKGFMRQLAALMAFEGETSFPAMRPEEVSIVTGAEDHILGVAHAREMRRLIPAAHHVTLAATGHMINIERPDLFGPFGHFA